MTLTGHRCKMKPLVQLFFTFLPLIVYFPTIGADLGDALQDQQTLSLTGSYPTKAATIHIAKQDIPEIPSRLLHRHDAPWDTWIDSIALSSYDSKLVVGIGGSRVSIDLKPFGLPYAFVVRDPFTPIPCIDGVPDLEQTAHSELPPLITFASEKDLLVKLALNKFAFFRPEKTTIGLLTGGAGASGGSHQTLYLFDTQSARHAIIEFSDCMGPEWFSMPTYPPSYAKISSIHYIGPRASAVALGDRVEEIFTFNDIQNTYTRNTKIENVWFSRLYKEATLTSEELDVLGKETLDDLVDADWDSEPRKLATKFMDMLYYANKTGNTYNAVALIKKLTPSLASEFRDAVRYMQEK